MRFVAQCYGAEPDDIHVNEESSLEELKKSFTKINKHAIDLDEQGV